MEAWKTSQKGDPAVRFFKHPLVWPCCMGTHPFTVEHVNSQATRGRSLCPNCGKTNDQRETLFVDMGQLEALFGLDVLMVRLPFDEKSAHVRDVTFNGCSGEVLYYSYCFDGGVPDPKELPRLIAPTSFQGEWFLPFRFLNTSGRPCKVVLSAVVKPEAQLTPVQELALQAVAAYRRRHFNVAAIMACSAVETALREPIAEIYNDRAVGVPGDLGFAALLERARLLLNLQPGAQLIGELRELNTARNNTAHRGQHKDLTPEKLVRWLVDVAVICEWARHAKPALPSMDRSEDDPAWQAD